MLQEEGFINRWRAWKRRARVIPLGGRGDEPLTGVVAKGGGTEPSEDARRTASGSEPRVQGSGFRDKIVSGLRALR